MELTLHEKTTDELLQNQKNAHKHANSKSLCKKADKQYKESFLNQQIILLSMVSEVCLAITSESTTIIMLQECCKSIVAHLNGIFASIWILNQDKNILELFASEGEHTRLNGKYSRQLVSDQNIIGNIALTKQPYSSNSVLGEPRIADKEWMEINGVVAFAGYPLIIDEKAIGVIALFARHSLSDITLYALKSVSAQIALGVGRKKAEDAYLKVNRGLKAVRMCNELLLQAKNEKKFSQDSCRIIVDLCGYHLAWIGLLTENEGKTVFPIADSGLPNYEFDTLECFWAAPEIWRGPPNKAIRELRPITCTDESSDLDCSHWLIELQKYGCNSLIALPLISHETPIGSLNIYSSEINAFDHDESQMLEELSKDISCGISRIRAYSKHQQSEKEKIELQRQVRQIHKMQSMGTFAAGIAHDFNNLLTPILCHANLVQYMIRDNSPEINASLKAILESAHRSTELVKQILTFSRQQEPDRHLIQISPIVKDTINLVRSSIHPSIELRENIQPSCGLVLADATELHQIVMNLCANANHAMRETGGILEVNLKDVHGDPHLSKVHPSLKEGSYVELSIKDTGPGIGEQTLCRIFDPFFTTKPVGEGTGMGLAVVHGIVESINGAIIVESQKNQGCSFRIFLPCTKVC